MISNKYRRPPTAVSAIDLDADDIDPLPREEYRQPYTYEETVSSNSEKRTARWCSITLILIIVIISLLSIAAVIIAIYTLVLVANKSATTVSISSTSTTASTASTGPICSSSPTTSYQYSTATPSQCVNYTNNTDPTRNAAYTQSINYCDNVAPFSNTTSVWIRFLDPAGTIIPNAPVAPDSCGTVATGWYAGQYPILLYTTATSIVCFYYATNTCADCNYISVTNCGTFDVYLLPSPDNCNYRYCAL